MEGNSRWFRRFVIGLLTFNVGINMLILLQAWGANHLLAMLSGIAIGLGIVVGIILGRSK